MVTVQKKMAQKPFRSEYTLDERKVESARLKEKYPDRIPIVVEADKSLKLDKCKFLVPKKCTRKSKRVATGTDATQEQLPDEFTMGHAMATIRKRCALTPEQALFFFVEDGSGAKQLLSVTELISSVAARHTNEDGFLYLYLTKENTFGAF